MKDWFDFNNDGKLDSFERSAKMSQFFNVMDDIEKDDDLFLDDIDDIDSYDKDPFDDDPFEDDF